MSKISRGAELWPKKPKKFTSIEVTSIKHGKSHSLPLGPSKDANRFTKELPTAFYNSPG